jgi:hypothetical protein
MSHYISWQGLTDANTLASISYDENEVLSIHTEEPYLQHLIFLVNYEWDKLS